MEKLLLILALGWFALGFTLVIWQWWRFKALAGILTPIATPTAENLPPLSLIVACHNEAQNLSKHLPLWLEQEYPNFEIIAVDDHSQDQTAKILEEFSSRYSRLRCISLSADANPAKKKAIAAGIEAAQYEHLVFCDADCRPATKQWLKFFGSEFAEKKDLILGYGKLEGSGWIQGLVDFETVRSTASYWHYAYRGHPYGGVGRNLAYTKSLYLANPEHKKHYDLRSGDDDLFINSLKNEVAIGLVAEADAFTYSNAPRTFLRWLSQKGRHYSTAWRYPLKYQISLGFEGAAILLFWLLLPIGFSLNPWSALSLLILRYAVNLELGRHKALFSKPRLNLLWPLWELIWVLSTFALHLRNLVFGASKKW